MKYQPSTDGNHYLGAVEDNDCILSALLHITKRSIHIRVLPSADGGVYTQVSGEGIDMMFYGSPFRLELGRYIYDGGS